MLAEYGDTVIRSGGADQLDSPPRTVTAQLSAVGQPPCFTCAEREGEVNFSTNQQ